MNLLSKAILSATVALALTATSCQSAKFTGDTLRMDMNAYTEGTVSYKGSEIAYRAYEGIVYVASPVDTDYQTMNIYIPSAYFEGGEVNGYTAKTAPIFFPNTVGGYMPGPADQPGLDPHGKGPNSIFCALEHGYVVASAGVRGRTSGKVTTEFFEGSVGGTVSEATGRMVGRAPAFIVDYKAAIRWLRHNADAIPGDVERIVTNGTSAGGALSALAGATGNVGDFEPYLREIGALEGRDDVWAASCYCPIHNLEHADAAYEWLFCGHDDWHRTKHQRTDDGGFVRVPDEGVMSVEQAALSPLLKALFPAYVNGLGLVGEDGEALTLEADGTGSFADWVRRWVVASAQHELDTHDNERNRVWLQVAGSQIDAQGYLEVRDGRVVGLDWEAFVAKISRMKAAPAFDALDLRSPENEEFGDEHVDARHFTAFSTEHSTVAGAELASPEVVRLMNPVPWIADDNPGVAPHWRVRHGSFDRDTSLAIPVILATMLANKGFDVDFALPWGLPHSGDYDLDELFAWIDGLGEKS